MRAIAAVLTMTLVLVSSDGYALEVVNLSGNNFSIQEPAAIGEELTVVGLLSQVQNDPPISVPGITDWSTEYTVYVHGLTLASDPTAFQRNFTGGTIEIWSQAPPNAPWTPTTPVASIPDRSGSVPDVFADGTLVLQGSFSSFTILDWTTTGGDTATITNTNIDFTAGSALPELQNLGLTDGWSWSGWYDVSAPVPGGYEILYGGKLEVEAPTPVESTTWGRVKSLF